MDFIIGLPRTNKQHNSIMVVVEKVIKSAHFVSVKTTHTTTNIADIFMKEIVRFHGIPRTIISRQRYKVYLQFLEGIV
jgi:hypothetical protein